jgi:hypothetical protein
MHGKINICRILVVVPEGKRSFEVYGKVILEWSLEGLVGKVWN